MRAVVCRPTAAALSSSSTCRSMSSSQACAATSRLRSAFSLQLVECTKPPSSACGPVAFTCFASRIACAASSNSGSLIRLTCSSFSLPAHSCASSAITGHAIGSDSGSHQSTCVRTCVVPHSQAHCRPREARSRTSAGVQCTRSASIASMAPSRPGRTSFMRGRVKALSRCVWASTKPGSASLPAASHQPCETGASAACMGRTDCTRPASIARRASTGTPSCSGQSVGSSQRGSRRLSISAGAFMRSAPWPGPRAP